MFEVALNPSFTKPIIFENKDESESLGRKNTRKKKKSRKSNDVSFLGCEINLRSFLLSIDFEEQLLQLPQVNN